MCIRPMRKCGVPGLFRKIEANRLNFVATQALLSSASVLSEGGVVPDCAGELVYNGSTMLNIDLKKFNLKKQEIGEESLIQHLKHSIGFRIELMRLARAEAERRCLPRLLGEINTEPEFKIENNMLLIDIDVVGAIALLDLKTKSTPQGSI